MYIVDDIIVLYAGERQKLCRNSCMVTHLHSSVEQPDNKKPVIEYQNRIFHNSDLFLIYLLPCLQIKMTIPCKDKKWDIEYMLEMVRFSFIAQAESVSFPNQPIHHLVNWNTSTYYTQEKRGLQNGSIIINHICLTLVLTN